MSTTLSCRRSPALTLFAIAASGLIGGCIFDGAPFEQKTTLPAPTGTLHALNVETRNGSIDVSRGDAIVITATLHMATQERLGQATLVANIDHDGCLKVRAEPPSGGWRNSEGCSFDIVLPGAVPVELRTGNGDVTCRSMSGAAVVQTSNGTVTVLDQKGTVKANTSNGRVEVRGATGSVDAETSNGSVTVALAAESPGPVSIHTSNGSVTLDVGQSFVGALELHTSNGSISLPHAMNLAGGRAITIKQQERHDTTVQFGPGQRPTSEVTTSNGSISVKF